MDDADPELETGDEPLRHRVRGAAGSVFVKQAVTQTVLQSLKNLKIIIPFLACSFVFFSAFQIIVSSCELDNQRTHQNISIAFPQFSPTPKDEIPSFDETRMNAYDKRYSNYVYAYSVELPKGVTGFSEPDPLPKHGIGIILSKNPKSYLWIDGSYNALFLKSLDDAINQELKWLEDNGTNLEVLKREKTSLHTLPAMRLTVKYKSIASEQIRVKDLIIALRPHKNDANGIIYTVGLIAPDARYKEDTSIFEKIVNGWRKQSLPN